MPSMTKRVNVQAPVAIRNINPPIYGTCKDIIMSTGDILKCLIRKAIVDEILPDGSTVRLNIKNYYSDNGAGLDAKKEDSVIIKKKETSVLDNKLASDTGKKPVTIEFNNTTIGEGTNDNATDGNSNSDEDTSVNSVDSVDTEFSDDVEHVDVDSVTSDSDKKSDTDTIIEDVVDSIKTETDVDESVDAIAETNNASEDMTNSESEGDVIGKVDEDTDTDTTSEESVGTKETTVENSDAEKDTKLPPASKKKTTKSSTTKKKTSK